MSEKQASMSLRAVINDATQEAKKRKGRKGRMRQKAAQALEEIQAELNWRERWR